MSHWAEELIGRPWVYGAAGPDAFDCFGFVRYVQALHYGVTMPNIEAPESWIAAHTLIRDHAERQRWLLCEAPQDGHIILMAKSRHPVHIGVVVQAASVLGALHCVQGSGVVFQRLANLPASGWGKLTYYRRSDAS